MKKLCALIVTVAVVGSWYYFSWLVGYPLLCIGVAGLYAWARYDITHMELDFESAEMARWAGLRMLNGVSVCVAVVLVIVGLFLVL